MWVQQGQMRRGQTLSLQQGWQLAQAWYSDRLELDHQRKTPEEIEAIFSEVGMTDDFWSLS